MMEKCLARARRKDNGEWVVGYYACESNHACFENELEYHHYIFVDVFMDWGLGGLQKIEVIPETVCRFTGLRDNKRTNTNNVGQMIFEGDICQDEHCVVLVLWQSYQWSCKVLKGCVLSRGNSFPLWQWDNCPENGNRQLEVIGNIYDNPELLEGGGQV